MCPDLQPETHRNPAFFKKAVLYGQHNGGEPLNVCIPVSGPSVFVNLALRVVVL